MSSSDWQTASERLNRYASMDPALGRQLLELGKGQARNDKIAFKLEEGRIYGLRQQYYDFILQRELARMPALVEPHW